MFIADEENSHERLWRQGEIQRIRGEVVKRLRVRPDFQLLLDKPMWINTGELPVDREVCQLADVALYCAAEAWRQQDTSSWAYQILGRISPYIVRHWISGEIWDGGMTIYPRPSRYPDWRFPPTG